MGIKRPGKEQRTYLRLRKGLSYITVYDTLIATYTESNMNSLRRLACSSVVRAVSNVQYTQKPLGKLFFSPKPPMGITRGITSLSPNISKLQRNSAMPVARMQVLGGIRHTTAGHKKALKTKKAVSKRFILTGKGKLKRGHAFRRHLTSHKSPKRKRNLAAKEVMTGTWAKKMKKLILFGK